MLFISIFLFSIRLGFNRFLFLESNDLARLKFYRQRSIKPLTTELLEEINCVLHKGHRCPREDGGSNQVEGLDLETRKIRMTRAVLNAVA